MPIVFQTPPQVPIAPPAPPPGAAPGLAGQVPSIGDLQAYVQLLTGQIAGLNAERSGLMTQLRSGSVADRASTIAELDRVNHQLAISTGQLANARAELAIRQSVQRTANPARDFPRRGPDPDVMAGLAFAFIFAVMMPIAIAYSRRIWRGKPAPPPLPHRDDLSDARLERLEQAVDSIAIEIERVSEGQRFVTKVLTERMPIAKAAPQDPAVETPLRALGAGPLEPIRVAERVAERQAVRQSITPH